MKNYHKTILVVEDQREDQVIITRAWRDVGVTEPIQVVGNGEEAIKYMMGEGKYSDRKAYPYPTFIMTDLKMPRLDGFAVLEHLRRNPDWAVIPKVVFSASEDPDDVKIAYQLGASAYHLKPSGFDGFCHVLRLLHEYWMTCEVPEVEPGGRLSDTESRGKLGERFARHPTEAEAEQTR